MLSENWEHQINELVKKEHNDYKIKWIYTKDDAIDVSNIINHLSLLNTSLLINKNNKNKMHQLVVKFIKKTPLELLIINLTKDEYPYGKVEIVKNGYVKGNMFNSPNIIVFSDKYPDIQKYSLARWEIYEIKNNILVENSLTEIWINKK